MNVAVGFGFVDSAVTEAGLTAGTPWTRGDDGYVHDDAAIVS